MSISIKNAICNIRIKVVSFLVYRGLAWHYSFGSGFLGFVCGSLFTVTALIAFVEYQERKNALLSVFERNKRRMEVVKRKKREEELAPTFSGGAKEKVEEVQPIFAARS